MTVEGLVKINSNDIENKATKLLLHFHPSYFKHYLSTPLLSIVDFLKEKHKIIFDFDTSLGFNNDNYKLLGAFNPAKRIILIDVSLKDDLAKFNFTLAHELGHLALHRNLKIKYDETDEDIPTETATAPFFKRDLKSDIDWMEWQANTYASCLLLPTEILKTALVSCQKQLGISRTGAIFVDNQPCNQQSFFQLINLLSLKFGVSKSVVEYRLLKLKLIDDRRQGYQSLNEVLRNSKYS
ncbi:ImmA/IrrE family metallo-endopeptidase [Ferruginibacter sp. HRS2-29]|uniref:ImmA/IrrE family metallo-endopeptidase n=1 Tax=Ferruginibacter sp. HRS2-29 TaxID=2487334 RepID=UPI0020CDA351|nr:ImmA/IrrE family metallo-endopeptidase [Ferruginibacter sp. HRS2-29]MCP9749668.1 ImmA/IrrE family metallo-endopeptidase [Ferruginibacter sp. HRS2-29]